MKLSHCQTARVWDVIIINVQVGSFFGLQRSLRVRFKAFVYRETPQAEGVNPARLALALLLIHSPVLAVTYTPTGSSTIQMEAYFVSPGTSKPPSHIRVPIGETVQMRAPEGFAGPFQWYKGKNPIVGATDGVYIIAYATEGDTASYSVTGLPAKWAPSAIMLDVVGSGHLGNFSSRLNLKSGNDTQIIGYVVVGSQQKTLMIRAVGPSLQAFGITATVGKPRISITDAKGTKVGFSPDFRDVNWPELFGLLGAFPLSGNEGPEAFFYGSFAPGAYAIQVSDDTKVGGTVLVEVYESTVPAY